LQLFVALRYQAHKIIHGLNKLILVQESGSKPLVFLSAAKDMQEREETPLFKMIFGSMTL
jgi:hypothetical protein